MPTKPTSKNIYCTTYLDPATAEAVRRRAERKGLTLSQYLRNLVAKDLESDGGLDTEVGKRTLFLSIGVDQLLGHVDPELRQKVHGLFRARLQEVADHAG